MAIFEDNRELSRQERYIGMDKVKGFKKGALALMGYKDTGERNALGKTGLFGNPLGRLGAKSLAKGSDAHQVMKETDDEYLSAGLAKAKFMYESGKLAAKLIAGGTGGVGGTGKVGGEVGGATPDLATTGIGDAANMSGDIVSSGGSNLASDVVGSNISTSTAGEALTKQLARQNIPKAIEESNSNADLITGNKTDSELVNGMGKDDYIIDSSGNKILNKDSDVDVEDQSLEEIEEAEKLKKEENKKKRNKMLSKVPLIGGVASSGLELIAAQKNYTQEAKKEAQVFKEMTAKDSQFNLL